MKILRIGFVIASLLISLTLSLAAKAQSYDCYEDKGNICLAQCGTFADTNYDLASPDPSGPFTATAVYPQCTKTCEGHAIGIDYSSNTSPCYEDEDRIKRLRVESLNELFPGAPIFVASCSGRLDLVVRLQSDHEVFLLSSSQEKVSRTLDWKKGMK